MISLVTVALLSAAPPVDVLARVSSAIDCRPTTKAFRAWCGATQTGTAGFRTPKDARVLLGLRASLPAGVDVRDTLLATMRVSALTFSGGKVKLTDVTPDTLSEARQLDEVAGRVAAALQGRAAKLEISPDLEAFLPVLVDRAGTEGAPISDSVRGPAQVTLSNPTRMWTVKSGALEVYVVVEDSADGPWLSVYPVVPASSK